MDLGIAGRVALVTASSRGLGYDVACRLAQEGVKLAMCARTVEVLQDAADRIRDSYQTEVQNIVCDLTDERQSTSMVDDVIGRFGAVDILVVNCGGPPSGAFMEHDDRRWRDAVDLNLMSAVYLTRAVVPQMMKRRWGRIVFMTSISVKQPIDGLILSNSVRAATVGLAKSLANELGPYGICVNSVCPGYFQTGRVQQLAEQHASKTQGRPQDLLDAWARQNALQRVGDPAEFGPLVAFLCSERAAYLTGTAIAIDGGLCRSLY